MTTTEVAAAGWREFFERIQAFAHGALLRIELVQPDGAVKIIARDLPLQRIALDDQSDPCNTNLIIEAGLPGERPIQHLALELIHVRLKNGDGQRFNHVHILAENGTTTLTFHPGLNPVLVKGLETGRKSNAVQL